MFFAIIQVILVVALPLLTLYVLNAFHGQKRSAGSDSACNNNQDIQEPLPAVDAASSGSVSKPQPVSAEKVPSGPKILIAYATNSQNALSLAHKLFTVISTALTVQYGGVETSAVIPTVRILELREEDKHTCSLDTLLEDSSYVLTIFVVSTFTDGKAPPRSEAFASCLQDAYEDHRVSRDALSRKRFAVFGLGDIAYGEKNFNVFAKNLHTWCRGLGAPAFVVPPVHATEAKVATLFQVFTTALLKWLSRAEFCADGTLVVHKKSTAAAAVAKKLSSKQSCCSTAAAESSEECKCASNAVGDSEEEDEGSNAAQGEEDVDDVEDLIWDGQDDENGVDENGELPELLYPKLRDNLTKQGYHLVGSHSGVKLCRWTKSMLRGRGGCYKHTFYNINSSQCMEMTPSLACANKCVFCWRHHTNPVSRTFRWKQDPPELLIAGGMAGHQRMIKQMRGVPGVTPERLADAMNIRHCALSLVGEPIMYPQINEFCDMLHERKISSFMVTNAQFPEQLHNLKPVVQLYLSIDAPTPEELKRIDRPLFEDYWDRCLGCVRELHAKQQRTVFRLTLVNQYNESNVAAYADLVSMGWPDFIEVKGVTYCGTSNSSTLTMKENVPRHDEVIQFCKALCGEMASRHPKYDAPSMASSASPLTQEDDSDVIVIPEEERNRPYHIACEHEHSCCVLIALDKFYQNQRWHTWIDYDKFYELAADGNTDFTSMDYMAPTPAWATYKSKEKGFDPLQERVIRKNGRPTVITSGC